MSYCFNVTLVLQHKENIKKNTDVFHYKSDKSQ